VALDDHTLCNAIRCTPLLAENDALPEGQQVTLLAHAI